MVGEVGGVSWEGAGARGTISMRDAGGEIEEAVVEDMVRGWWLWWLWWRVMRWLSWDEVKARRVPFYGL